jgi:hypothetical protein
MKPEFKHFGRTAKFLSLFLASRARKPRGRRPVSKRQQRDRRQAAGLPWRSNILGIGVGEKFTEGERVEGTLCVKFYVRRKLAKARIPARHVIPPSLSFESVGAEVLTDVHHLGGRPILHAGPRIRPLSPGAEIGSFRGSIGTLGLFVKRPGDNTPLILSCYHVLADFGQGKKDDPIEQPLEGLGPIKNVVGRLVDPSIPVDPFAANDIDAALAVVAEGVAVDRAILQIGQPAGINDLSQQDFASISQLNLVRTGATTNRQEGTLDSVNATFTVLDDTSGRNVTFNNVVVYNASCAAGDSGAAVLERDTNRVVGLHFGGTGPQGFFIHIQTIFDRLNVELY